MKDDTTTEERIQLRNVNRCIDCRIRNDCANSDKELTCEEFRAYMQEQELQFFQNKIEKDVDNDVPSKLY